MSRAPIANPRTSGSQDSRVYGSGIFPQDELRARVEVLERQVRVLERQCQVRQPEAADVGFVLALVECFGGGSFTSADVRRGPHEALRTVLDEQGLRKTTAIGFRLRTLRGRSVAGFRLILAKRMGSCRLWSIEPNPEECR